MPLIYHHLTTRQDGSSLIEALVAAFIFAVGILTVAGLQLNGMNTLSNSNSINAAMAGASDIADRMRANPAGIEAGAYDAIEAENVTDPECGNGCTTAQLALRDAHQVYQQLLGELPESTLEITNAGSGIFTVDISWLERSGDQQETLQHRISFRPYTP